jgi:outer membrane protein assembly factor BamD (BamD/ComL family)
MSISAISSINNGYEQTQSVQNNQQLFQQEFQQLGQDLTSGKLSAAQQDYAKLQQDSPTAVKSLIHHRHPHRMGGGSGSNSDSNDVSQLFSELGQDLQSGNVSAAQQAYSSLLQDVPQLGAATAQTGASSTGVSLTA